MPDSLQTVTRTGARRDLKVMMVADVAGCYDKHGEALVRFAASQVGWSNADDLVSAAVLGVLQRGPSGIADLRAYLYRSIANAGAKHWRTTMRRQDRERAFELPSDPTSGLETDDGTSDVQVALQSALGGLSTQQRAVVHLTYWEDLTPAAAAERLGVTEGSVRRQLARARARLRAALDSEGAR